MDEREKRSNSSKAPLPMPNERHTTPAGRAKNEEIVFQRDDTRAILLLKDMDENVSSLKDSFKSVCNVVCMCPGKVQTPMVDFGHFQTGIHMCTIVKQIQRRVDERVELTLMRNCLLRLQASCQFVGELENIMEYYLTYLKDLQMRGSTYLERDFAFKGHRFHELCLTAKEHLTFWSAFLERYSKEPRFKRTYSLLENDVRKAHSALLRVIGRFPGMISTIVAYVLNTAYVQKWGMPDQLLKDISSAIEDLNRLDEYSRSILNGNDIIFKTGSINSFADFSTCKIFGICSTLKRSPVDISVSLNKLFAETATKRARILGVHLLNFLHEQDDISNNMKRDSSCTFDWNPLRRDISDQRPDPDNDVIPSHCDPTPRMELDPESPLACYASVEYQFITELVFKLATSTTLMSSYGVDKKLFMHKSLPQKGLYHGDADDHHGIADGITCETHSSEPEAGHSILKHSPASVSPRLNKRVQWHHSVDIDSKAQVSVLYMDILWSSCSVVISEMLELLSWDSEYKGFFGPLPLWSEEVFVSVIKVLESLSVSESLPPEEAKSFQLVGRYIHCLGVIATWDKGFCKILSVSQKDKCSSTTKPDTHFPSSKTLLLTIDLFHPMRSIFEAAQNWKHHAGSSDYNSIYMVKDLSSSLLPFVSRLQALLSFVLRWLDTKLYHFLSGWNLSPMLLLVHWDLPILLEVMRATIKSVKPLCVGQGVNNSWGSLPVQLEELQGIFKEIEELGSIYSQLFKTDLTKMCTEFFQEAMPIGKSWKKSRQSGIPCKHNSYVEHAISQILEPVMIATELLSSELRILLLSLTTTTMMESWSAYILKEQIIFSFYGAQQMQLDFNYIKCWISSESSTLPINIQSCLLGLEAFHHLDGATRLLMLQPRKKKQMDELDVELESNISAVSSSSVLSSFSGVDIDSYETDVLNDKTIPNKQHWLDLRLRGGKSKKGLLPFCLKVQEMK